MNLPDNWWKAVMPYVRSNDYARLTHLNLALKEEYQRGKKILPQKDLIFNAFHLTPFNAVKVLILGQDPYPNPQNPMGLAFSVRDDVPVPASLRNIYQELEADLKISPAHTGNLTPWAKQGVLLLNTVLTVEAGKPNSHQKLGWEHLTLPVIKALNEKSGKLAICLWGNPAKQYLPYFTNPDHLVLTSSHPSPLSYQKTQEPFKGSRPFSKINHYLENEAINWRLEKGS